MLHGAIILLGRGTLRLHEVAVHEHARVSFIRVEGEHGSPRGIDHDPAGLEGTGGLVAFRLAAAHPLPGNYEEQPD